MHSSRRCVYNLIRDTAAGHKGVACFRSYTEIAERCGLDKRGASEVCNAMVAGNQVARQKVRCFVPIDPSEERQVIVAEVASLTTRPTWQVALVAFQETRRQPLPDLPAVLASAETIRSRLRSLGYWG